MSGLRPEIVLECVPQSLLRARGTIPRDLPLFQDHFPEFPVLPGVLSLEILKRSIEACLKAGQHPDKPVQLVRTENVRFQHFLRPGETWECRVERISPDDKAPGSWKGRLTVQERGAVSAQFIFADVR